MKILFDHGTPAPLRRHLAGHEIATAYEMGWAKLSNGDLLAHGGKIRSTVFVTTDQNLRYQQNLGGQTAGDSGFANHQLAGNSKTHEQGG